MKSINDLNRLDEKIAEKIKDAVLTCLDSGWFVLGQNVSSFENEFSKYIGTNFAVSVANGTEALEIALNAAGVVSGDEVITVANAGFYSSFGILACGATPIYADVDSVSYTMDPDSLISSITPKTKAVILTHLYGRMGDVDKISAICKKKNLVFIEDCAQAHGASRNGKKAGSFGEISCFSFYPTKNLGAMGDGGAVLTSDEKLADSLKKIRQYGWGKKYHVDYPNGRNSRLDEVQAAVLRIKLEYLDQWNEKRRQVALKYDKGIQHSSVTRNKGFTGEEYVGHLYVMECDDRESLSAHLKRNGIPFDVHYPVPDYRQKIISQKYQGFNLPVTEKTVARIITLPCFPEMTEDEITSVIFEVNSWRS